MARPSTSKNTDCEGHWSRPTPHPGPPPQGGREAEGTLETSTNRLRWLAPGIALILSLGLTSSEVSRAQTPPTAKGKPTDLLKASTPFDRIILTDNATFDVEPLNPRPLPPIDRKKKAADTSRRNDPFSRKDDGEGEQMVIIHLLDGEPRDFKTRRSSIKDVEYFEDMLLNEVDRLIKEGEYVKAFERIQLVKNRDPNWRGLDDRVNKLLFEEGSASLIEDNARGLRLLTDLHARKPDYPGLADRLVSTYIRRIERALAAGDYLTSRRLVREIETIAPNHPEGRTARNTIIEKARGLVALSAKSNPSDRVDRLAEAWKVWPETEGLETAYREAFRAEPTLAVAVEDLPEPVGPFPNSPASARVARLLYLPLLASDDEAALRGEAGSQLLAGMETFELGKGLRINLKLGPTWSDGSRPVTALDVARSLADRALPASPGYNARWADLLDKVEATQEDQLVIKLTRSTMKPESWLLGPIGPAHSASDGWVSSLDQGRRPVGDGPYRWDSATDNTNLLHSVASTGTSEPAPKIKRIREVRYPNPTATFEAFVRGEVALLEHVPPEKLADLTREPERFKVGRFNTPSVHAIALDGRKPALRNRNLRRALSLAIDRRGLLEIVLRHPPDEVNTIADGPFVRGSFVDAPDVEPFAYNPLLAKGLINAVRKEMGGNPIRLTLDYPATPEARAACPRIAEAFALIGVELKLVEHPESELEASLRSGRKFDLAYRTSRPAQPLRDAGPLILPGYDAPPSADALASAASPRILQLLIDLDRAPETTSARTLALQIDRESRDELPILPLWQIEDHYAWRATLKGPLEAADHLYQGIAAWEIEPWLVKD